MIHPVVQEYFQNWRAPDQGGKLEVDDERDGFAPDSPRITKNENSQLFAVMTYFEMDRLNILPKGTEDSFKLMMAYSQVPGFPGLYYRRYKDTGIRQSHDNIIGIVGGSVLFNTLHAHEIAAYGVVNGWCFNVHPPKKWVIESCIQGGDIALIKLAVGWTPTIWEHIWLCGGLMLTRNNAGSVNLAQFRFDILNKAGAMTKDNWFSLLLRTSEIIFKWRHHRNGSTFWAIEDYFKREGQENPIIRLKRAKTKEELK